MKNWLTHRPAILFLAVSLLPAPKIVIKDSPSTQKVEKSCGSIYYGSYEPETPRSLRAIPVDIRSKLTAHLQSWFGPDFFDRLQFSGGQIVDLKKLYRVDPDAREYKWTIPTYRLHFNLALPEKGIDRYCCEIELDESGRVIEEVDFPPVATDPRKSVILSLDEARLIARQQGRDLDLANPEIRYERASQSLIWLFRAPRVEQAGGFRMSVLNVDAHNREHIWWTEEVGDY